MKTITDDDYARLMELAKVAKDLTQSQKVYDAARDLLDRHQCAAVPAMWVPTDKVKAE